LLKRVLKGLTAIFFGQVLVAIGNLLLVPLFLAYWPAAVYGEWLALYSLACYLSTLDLGLHSAVTNRLTQAYARNDLREYVRFQHSALAFYAVLAVSVGMLLVLGAWHLPLHRWLGLKHASRNDAFWVVVLLGSQFLWAMPVGQLGATYRTVGNLAKSVWITNAQRGLMVTLVAAGLAAGGGPKTVAFLQLCPLLAVAGYVVMDLTRHHPALTPGVREAAVPVLRSLLGPSLSFFLMMLANAIAQQGSVILVSSALGGVAVAVYVTSRTVGNLVRQVVNSLTSAVWPELTRLEARREYSKLRLLHQLLVMGSTAAGVALAAALWYEGSEVIAVWTRGRLTPDPVLLRLLLVYVALQVPWLASSAFTSAANLHSRLARSQLVASVVGVALAALLVSRLATWAVPLGLVLGELLACYHFVIKDTCGVLGEDYGMFARRLWFGLPVLAAACLGAGWAVYQIAWGPPPLRWLQTGIATAVAAVLASCQVWLRGELRPAVASQLRAWIARWTGASTLRPAL